MRYDLRKIPSAGRNFRPSLVSAIRFMLDKPLKYKPNPHFVAAKLNIPLEQVQHLPNMEGTTDAVSAEVPKALTLNNPTGFEPPIGGTEHLPFHFKRTPFGNLPVYMDYKNGRTKIVTVVRKIEGDVQEVRRELETLTGLPVEVKQGSLLIKGNQSALVKAWMRALGF
eukprot:GEZU01035849.1.p1 GENE.GEZU01035849.1~~GEZU01035849.1.p1  ORF type:complete len:184 (-),score=7.23 GEZU01035849.1:111-614(-)